MAERTAIVTGGGRGIGRAVVERLRGEWTVLACGRGERPAGLAAEVLWVRADVARPGEAERIVAAAPGPVGCLVNNAGVQVEKTLADSTDADWERVVGVNCRGVFAMTRAVLPGMTETGGAIVNIGSISGRQSDAAMALYNASKAFVHALTRSVAVDHGPKVRCNAVCPGWIVTEMATDAFALARDPAAAEADARARTPAGRLGRPGDIAEAVAWLASDAAAFVTGATLTVDGGMTAASPIRPELF